MSSPAQDSAEIQQPSCPSLPQNYHSRIVKIAFEQLENAMKLESITEIQDSLALLHGDYKVFAAARLLIHIVVHASEMNFKEQEEMVECIVKCSPRCVEVQGIDGNMPLHFAVMNPHIRASTTSILVAANPMICMKANSHNQLPIHLLVTFEPCLDKLKLLLSACPDCVKSESLSDTLPLHILMQRKDMLSHIEIFSVLVEAYPQALLVEITQDSVTLSLDGCPPVRKVEKWSPYSRAMSSSESVRFALENTLSRIARKHLFEN